MLCGDFYERQHTYAVVANGLFSAICACFMWGFLPIYWKLLNQFSALEILSHRIIWSLIFLLLFIFVARRFCTFRKEISSF
jgi:chloramphenicol-sensitive protein RarD